MAANLFNGASAAGLLAAISLIASTAGAFALGQPTTDFSRAFGLAVSSEALADSIVRDPSMDAAGHEAAVAASRRTLSQAPATATAWLRLAYLDSLTPGGLGPDGNRAFAASYVAAPYGPDDTAWRLQFALNHWQAMEVSNRRLVLSELRYVARVRPAVLQQVRSSITDPIGMLALSLTVPAPTV